jgi:hypothetical protein
MIQPKTILVSQIDHSDPCEVESYSLADKLIQKIAASVVREERLHLHILVVFTDLFGWTTNLSVGGQDATKQQFVQHAIQADWEFNAGVRPTWWPRGHEADRMWGVHYREDRDNGRAELARMRLERYDLGPVVLAALPPRAGSIDAGGGTRIEQVPPSSGLSGLQPA